MIKYLIWGWVVKNLASCSLKCGEVCRSSSPPSLAMSACPTVSKLYCTGFPPNYHAKDFFEARPGLPAKKRKKSPFSGSEDGLGQGLGQAVDQSREGKPLHRLAHGEGAGAQNLILVHDGDGANRLALGDRRAQFRI